MLNVSRVFLLLFLFFFKLTYSQAVQDSVLTVHLNNIGLQSSSIDSCVLFIVTPQLSNDSVKLVTHYRLITFKKNYVLINQFEFINNSNGGYLSFSDTIRNECNCMNSFNKMLIIKGVYSNYENKSLFFVLKNGKINSLTSLPYKPEENEEEAFNELFLW